MTGPSTKTPKLLSAVALFLAGATGCSGASGRHPASAITAPSSSATTGTLTLSSPGSLHAKAQTVTAPVAPAAFSGFSNFQYIDFDGYPIPVVTRKPPSISPTIAVNHQILQNTVATTTIQTGTGGYNSIGTECTTTAISYHAMDPQTNLATRTFTFDCPGYVVNQNDVFDRGPAGPVNPVATLITKTTKSFSATSQAAIKN